MTTLTRARAISLAMKDKANKHRRAGVAPTAFRTTSKSGRSNRAGYIEVLVATESHIIDRMPAPECQSDLTVQNTLTCAGYSAKDDKIVKPGR